MGFLTRDRTDAAPPAAPETRRVVEDTVEFSNYLERDARTRTDPTYADYLEKRSRSLREYRAGLVRDLPLFTAAYAKDQPIESSAPPPYAGAKIGDVIAKIGPPPPPKTQHVTLVTDLGVMGQLIDTLI